MIEGESTKKSPRALAEERILAFWKEHDIFKKSLEKNKGGKEFVFFEGPPTANAKPALHHLEARAFKDVIPRYKTMQGFSVPRRAGWDTHGLPVELQIEKKLGLQSKKEIEQYGIAKFNQECKNSVFTYIKEWEVFTDRIGYWVDQEHAYHTFNPSYMESLWNIVGEVDKRGLLYKDYKVVPWCARCGTALASHELAQEYQDDKDLTVYAKFKVRSGQNIGTFTTDDNTYLIAWTTTPWTLPGNVALAVGKDIEYILVESEGSNYFLAKERLSLFEKECRIIGSCKGEELVGLEYEPLYDVPQLKSEASYKVYAADFVTTTDGTGIVHIAPMYGADDFALASKAGLPKVHTVGDDGKFVVDIDFLTGRFVKDEEVAVDIIKDLARRGLLFKKEKYEHSYPHCWRCKTPLIYYARDSWYIAMSTLRDKLLSANEGINWEPEHIKEGRFGEWLREVKDWAISRERYWGTPLPIWVNDVGERMVVDSIATLRAHAKKAKNCYFVMRHGETEHNKLGLWNYGNQDGDPLTENGKAQVDSTIQSLRDSGIDTIIASPFIRTRETAERVADALGISREAIQTDERLAEWRIGKEYDGKPVEDFFAVRNASVDRYGFNPEDGESYLDIIARASECLDAIEREHSGKTILIVSHGAVTRALELLSQGIMLDTLFATTREYRNFANAEVREVDVVLLPHNNSGEIDLHRPYIDEVVLEKDGKEYRRVKEVMDVWFDSGSMPFAQDHYPFEHKDDLPYPADFISEAIDQTRGWFYTLLSVGVLMRRGTPYKNVICLGHLLDKDGKKMSKSVGNIVEPFEQIEKFGVDAVRYWMYSVNQPGESKNYDEKSVAEINNKVFNLLSNVHSFYELYRDKSLEGARGESGNVLDQWIMTRLSQTIEAVSTGLDGYDLFTPTRTIREFCDDLSTWYLRRSRDRLKDANTKDSTDAKRTLYIVLKTTAQLLAPFAPFFAEDIWQKLKTDSDAESVHLSDWPAHKDYEQRILNDMAYVRSISNIGNALRKKENIPVRQPLRGFTITHHGVEPAPWEQMKALIAEELNVKEVVFEHSDQEIPSYILHTEITPELKLEGEYRELVRTIQDLRKEKELTPSDIISVTLPVSYQEIVETFGEELKKTVGAKDVAVSGEEIVMQ